MQTAWKLALACGLVALPVRTAPAQFARGGWNSPGTLIANVEVQKELKLTVEQVWQVYAISKIAADNLLDRSNPGRILSPEEWTEHAERAIRTTDAETMKALRRVLTLPQRKRFEQIARQRAGAEVFQTAEVENALKLTDAQKAKIKEVIAGATKQVLKQAPQVGSFPDAEARKRLHEFTTESLKSRQETMTKALAVLTPGQRKAWSDLLGDPR